MKAWQLQEAWLCEYPYPLFILNQQGCVDETNEALCRLLSYTDEELKEIPFIQLITAEHQDRFRKAIAQAKMGEISSIETEVIAKNSKRKSLHMVVSSFHSSEEGQLRIHIITRDITSSQFLKRELIHSQLQLEHLFESLDVAIWSVDAKTYKLLHMSLGAEKVYGRPVYAFFNDSNLLRQIIHEEDLPRLIESRQHYSSGQAIVHEYRIIRGGQEIRWIHNRIIPELDHDGELVKLTGIAFDITEQKRMEEQIHQLAYYDAPTGLPNRAMLEKLLDSHAGKPDDAPSQLAVISLEATQLDLIADTLGLETADVALRQFADRATLCLPEAELICRTGDYSLGTVLRSAAGDQELHTAVQRFFQSLDGKFQIGPYEFYLTAAVGICKYPEDGTDSKALLQRAQTAMRRAKKTGFNDAKRYTPRYDEESYRAFMLEKDLFGALERQEFVMHYQPKFDMASREIVGVEALLRWDHPVCGLLKPVEFLALAQETNQIIPIGEWVLRTVCRQHHEWLELCLTPLRMGVNLSPQQILQHDFAGKIASILAEAGMDASWLELEITESTLKHAQKHLIKMLQDWGVTITIDNFGSGYSSLQSMKAGHKVNVLKLDTMFIRSMGDSDEDESIVDAVVYMAHRLGVKVAADGIETEEQLQALRKLGCDLGQGIVLCHPLQADELLKLLRK